MQRLSPLRYEQKWQHVNDENDNKEKCHDGNSNDNDVNIIEYGIEDYRKSNYINGDNEDELSQAENE